MTATKPTFGTVINIIDVRDKVSGPVKASTLLAVGLVYQDGSNGWTNAPTDGSIHGRKLFWNPVALDNSAGVKGAKAGTFYGEGALVVGKADGVITADSWCKASETGGHAGQFQIHNDPADGAIAATFADTEVEAALDAIRNWQRKKIALYKGHALEVIGNDTLPTSTADADTDAIFEIRRG